MNQKVNSSLIIFVSIWILIFSITYGIYLVSPKDPIENATIAPKSVVYIESVDRETIEKNLEIKLKKFNRNWNRFNFKQATDALLAGEEEFNIDHKVVLAIIALESEFKIVVARKNTDHTTDFGLTQQNSNYINGRYDRAEEILTRRKIKHSNSKFDIAKNIIAAYVYLNDIKKESGYDFQMTIKAYNVGIRGATQEKKQAKANRYFAAFANHYRESL